MVFQNDILAGASGTAAAYTIPQSIRFNDDDSAYLTKTFGADGGDTWTLSLWLKRGNISTAANQYFFSEAGGSGIGFVATSDKLRFYNASSVVDSTQVFRDVGGWYHFVFSNNAGTVTITVNNTAVQIGATTATLFNRNNAWSIGRYYDNTNHFDGYLAEIHWIDGQALAPTSFGEYDSVTGVWIPKAYAGSYGTNGFYITGADSADLGKDYSGNGNNFTSSGLTTADQVTDTPTNNYPVISPIDRQSGASAPLKDGNLVFENNNTGTTVDARATFAVSSGKWYWEVEADALGQSGVAREFVGVVSPVWKIDSGTGGQSFYMDSTGYAYMTTGLKGNNNTTAAYGTAWTAGDIIGVALDLDNGKIWWSLNGTFQNSGDPAAGTGEAYSGLSGTYAPAFAVDYGTGTSRLIANFGQTGGLTYTPPTGFKALSTANLPTPTVPRGSDYFNAITYLGNGGGQRVGGFQPMTETYTVDNGCRFNDDDSAYLTRTPSTGNRKTWTWSGWVKRGNLGISVATIFSAGVGAGDTDTMLFHFNSSDQFRFSGQATQFRVTTQTFKDPSAWYHFVVRFDTTQAVADDRLRIYVNGSQITSFAVNTALAINTDYAFNGNWAHDLGRSAKYGAYYYDGYMSEVNFIDGQSLGPDSFGELDSYTNKWVPKDASGLTFGTNGFYLDFVNSSDLGNDVSGNNNDFTSSGLASDDQVTDTPTNNYLTLNPLDDATGYTTTTVTNGNLDIPAVVGNAARGTFAVKQGDGKYVYEVTITSLSGSTDIGWSKAGVDLWAANGPEVMYEDDGNKLLSPNSVSAPARTAYGASYTAGDVIRVEANFIDSTIEFFKNNVSQGSIDFSGMNDGTPYFPAAYANNALLKFNFGQQPFVHTPTTGFVGLSADNLPASEAGISAFVWIKNRDALDNHMLFDRVRGVGNDMHSNATSAEVYNPNTLQSFLINGFQIGNDVEVNTANEDYVAWQWMTATTGTGTSNTDGSITSTVLADTTAGFSVVSYTGNGSSGATVGHGLGVTPKTVIVKPRSGVDHWLVSNWESGVTAFTEKLKLNANEAASSSSTQVNGGSSTTFTLGTDPNVNGNGTTYIAYVWNEVDGFSKFGTYTGNGSTDGPFVWCGFRPAFVISKRTDSADNWAMYDAARDPYNVAEKYLYADATNAEATFSTAKIDFLSNGFKWRGAVNFGNASGGTYVCMAFAENPFKYSLAR